MSKETSQWLNTQTLIGMTEHRGMAWHYRAEDQGAESNHYPEAIPVDDVLRRLFNFQVIESPLYIPNGHGGFSEVPGRKAMIADDNRHVMGVFKAGYLGHQYPEWLLDGPANLIDQSKGDLGIGSAGLLKNRAVAWVSVEVPDSLSTPEGIDFRPNLLACTSFDGSMATTYKRVVTAVVCDNTLSAGLSEGGQVFRIKHSSGSAVKLAEAREALNIIHTAAEDFALAVKNLAAWKVNTREFDLVLDAMVPVPEIPAGKNASAATTRAMNKHDELRRLYSHDLRVSPWKGTALGVLQMFNTYEHHVASRKGDAHRAQINMLRAVDGTTAAADALVLSTLAGVTG